MSHTSVAMSHFWPVWARDGGVELVENHTGVSTISLSGLVLAHPKIYL